MANGIVAWQTPSTVRFVYVASSMFENRVDAARRIAEAIRGRAFKEPLVLGIPRGGVVVASEIAEQIGAECDIVLARKLRAPDAPELAIGAVSENGDVYFNHPSREVPDFSIPEISDEYAHQECQTELREIARRKKMFREVRPAAPIVGRSVIMTDDGMATGATMIAALQAIRMQHPAEMMVAVPVASDDALREVGKWCDDIICLHLPRLFYAVGQFYDDFQQITDEEVAALLRHASGLAERHEASRRRRDDPLTAPSETWTNHSTK